MASMLASHGPGPQYSPPARLRGQPALRSEHFFMFYCGVCHSLVTTESLAIQNFLRAGDQRLAKLAAEGLDEHILGIELGPEAIDLPLRLCVVAI